MKNQVKTAVAAVALLGVVGCNSLDKKKKVEAAPAVPTEQAAAKEKKMSVFATYVGTFPCADCAGKDIRLTINRDGTYKLRYKYQDQDEDFVEDNGVYNVVEKDLIEVVTPSSGEKTYYKFKDNNLILSDSLGSVNEGELAHLYILKRQ